MILKVVNCVQHDNQVAYEGCKLALVQQQIAAGCECPCSFRPAYSVTPPFCSRLYVRNDQSCDTAILLQQAQRSGAIVHISAGVPPVILVDTDVFAGLLRNILHNAAAHGKPGSEINAAVMMEGEDLSVCITNAPGPNHGHALALQSELGDNFLLNQIEGFLPIARLHQLGAQQSTYLGPVCLMIGLCQG